MSAFSGGAQIISTAAGNFNGDGGIALYARISHITGIVTDPYGNIIFCDPSTHRVRKINSSGIISTVAGTAIGYDGDGGPAVSARMSWPTSIARDTSGNIYIVDRGNNVIRKVDASGIITTFAGTGSSSHSGDGSLATIAGIASPTAICLDAVGNVYVGSPGRVRKIDLTGIITTVAGTGTEGYDGDGGLATAAKIRRPKALLVDAANNLIILDSACVVRKVNTSGIISTIAGDGIMGHSGDGGAATAARLHIISGGTIDGAGNIYIVSQNCYVRKINPSGIITTIAGLGYMHFSGDGGSATLAGLVQPAGISVDATGNVYIGCTGQLRKINTAGIISTLVQNGGFSGDGPALAVTMSGVNGVVVTKAKKLYFTSEYSNRVMTISSGMVTTIAGGDSLGLSGDGGPASAAVISHPRGLACDTIGNIYFVDVGNRRIRKIDTNGVISTVKSFGIHISDVAVDNGGNVYASTAINQVCKISPSGATTVFAGTGTSGFSGDGGLATAAKLNAPMQIAFDNAGNAYIVDYFNNRVRKVTPSGVITTFAGNGTSGYTGDGGPATAARISARSVAVDKEGNVYIGGETAVRKVTPDGVITTYAGGNTGGYDGDGGPAASSKMSGCVQLAFDKDGRLYIAENGNSVVRLVAPQTYPITGDSIVCVGATATLANEGVGGTWSSSNSAIAAVGSSSGVVSGIAAGTATLTYTTPTGYSTTTVTVAGIGSAVTVTAEVCEGSTVIFDDLGSTGTWVSSNGNATVGSTGAVTGVTPGTVAISYSFASGCLLVTEVTVSPLPFAGIVSGASSLAVGASATLTASVTGGTWSSDASHASVTTAGVVSGISTGVAGISYSVSNSCGTAVAAKILTVGAETDGVIGIRRMCMGQTTTLGYAISGGTWSGSASSVATVSAGGVVSGLSAGTTIVTYIYSGGSVTSIATVDAPPNSGVVSAPDSVCQYSSITFTSTVSGGTWTTFGMASINPSTGYLTFDYAYDFVGPTSTWVMYKVTNSCGSDSVYKSVGINSFPYGEITGPTTVCMGSTTTYSLTGTPGQWHVYPGTGTATIDSVTGVLTPLTPGTVVIKYEWLHTPTCYATWPGELVTINSTTAPSVTISGSPSVTVGSSITLSSTVSGGTWSSSSNSKATVGSSTGVVTGVSTGTTTITYTVTNSCGTFTATKVVTVTMAPILGATSITGGGSIMLSHATPGGTWSTGCTAVATVASTGEVTAVSSGVATITYTVGGSATTTEVTVSMSTSAITGTATVCQAATTELGHPVNGGTWSSGNTSVATISSTGVVTGVAAGTAVVTYAYGGGCKSTRVVSVNALPHAGTISGPTTICAGSSATLISSVSGGTWWSSDMSKATIGTGTGIITGVNAGTALITYTVNDGCAGRTVATVTITAPMAGRITGPVLVNIGNTITLSSSISGGAWSSGSSNVGVSGGVVTGISAGTATVSYNVTSGGCIGVDTFIVGVVDPTDTSCPLWRQVGAPDLSTDITFEVKLAIGKNGVPYMAYMEWGGIYIYQFNGASWVKLYEMFGFSHLNNLCLALDGNGYPCIGLVDGEYGSPLIMRYTSEGWRGSLPGGAFEPGVSEMSLGTDSAGAVVVAYTFAWGEHSTDGHETVVRKFNGTGYDLIRSLPYVSTPKIVVAKNGTAYLQYGNWTTAPYGTLVDKYEGGTWTNVSIKPFVSGVPRPRHLTIDNSGNPYFFEAVSSTKWLVNKFNGTSFDRIGDTVLNVGDLSFSNTNVPHIIARNGSGSGSATVVSKLNGSSWDPVHTAGYASRNTTWQSLAINPQGLPFVAYSDSVSGKANVRRIDYGVPAITGNIAFCSGSTIALGNIAPFGTWSSSNSTVATVGSSTGIVSGVANGTAAITYAVGSCSATTIVTVGPVGAAGTLSGTSTVAQGSTITLSSTVSGGTWSASNSNATVSSTGVVTGVTAGTVIISYAKSTSCGTDVATKVVTISMGPILGPTSITGAGTITLTHATPGGTWSTTCNDIAVVNSGGEVTGVTSGLATITYTVGSSYTTTVITVNMTSSAISGINTVCAGAATTLSHPVSGGVWSTANTAVATAATGGLITGVAAGNTALTYSYTSGCSSFSSVTVNPLPDAGTISGASAVTTGSTITLSSSVSGGTWSSSNSNATVSSAGVVTGVTVGSATISYSVTNSCGTQVATKIVTVGSAVDATTGTLTLCSGQTTVLSNATPSGSWSSNNPTVATVTADGEVAGLSPGVANITYTAAAGYTVAQVTVNAQPAVITGTTNVCVGAATTLYSATAGGSWSSSNSNATVSTAGIVTGVTAGTATISYTGINGCARAAMVTVLGQPVISGTAATCAGSTTTLAASVAGTWSGGSATVATVGSTGIVTGIAAGTARITYNAGACRTTQVVTVNAAPASITGTLKACPGTTTTLASTTAGGTWSSSDGATATVAGGVVTGVAAGTAVISYTAGAGCSRTAVVTINATPASLTGTTTVCPGSTTTLTNGTAAASWGTSSTAVATVAGGVVTGVAAGTATITYTATGTGCKTTTTVTVNSAPAVIGGPATVCPGATVALTNTVAGGTWTSSNGAIASVNATTGIVTGVTGGAATITYTTGAGCYRTKAVTVSGSAAAITGYTTVCEGRTTALNTWGSGVWSSSNTGVATVVSPGTVTGVSAGTATISFTISATGCVATTVVTVIAMPPASTGTTTICSGQTTTLANATAGGSWVSANPAVASVGSATGIVTGVGTAGTVTISYKFGNVCAVNTPVTIKPLPAVIGGTYSVCATAATTLTSTTSGGTWSSSNTAVATVGTGLTAGHGAVSGLSAGTTTISYTLTTTGCARTAVVTVDVCSRPASPATEAMTMADLQLYPNPTTGAFTVITQEAGMLTVYSMDGKQVTGYSIAAGINQLTLPQHLTSGIYMCRYTGASGNTTMVRLVYER